MTAPTSKRPLAMIVGLAASLLIATGLHVSEATKLTPYYDVVHVATNCTGNTHNVDMNKKLTPEDCVAIDEANEAKTAEGVDACTPLAPMPTGQRAAAVMFAFNVGVPAYCRSGFARKLKARDPTACAELSKWIYAGDRPWPGLIARRARERAICERRDL